MYNISWKKGLFKCAYQLFENGSEVGKLKESPWSIGTAKGSLKEQSLRFKVKGSFSQIAVITDDVSGQRIGQVKFNCWWPKAKIVINGIEYQWKFKNAPSSRWKISNVNSSDSLDYKGASWKGSIYSETIDNDALILTGLFVANFYWQMTAVYIACLTPFWIFLL